MSILKRSISLLLCLVMLTSVLASCDTDNSHNHETDESKIEQTQGTTPDHTHDATEPSDETTEMPEQHTHTPVAVTENTIDSTCTKMGSYDEVVYCSVCHEEISRTQKTVDKKAHEYNQKVTTSTYLITSADCNNAAVYHYSCSCGAKGTTTFTDGKANGHSYSSDWEKNATHHWHKATCGHTSEISGEAEHNYGTDNVCDTCKYDRTVNVSGVTLNFSSLALTVDDVKTLIATIAPNNATNQSVTWTTSNASIVAVDTNGKITAVGVGTAVITATTADGNKTAQCTVVVLAKVCLHTTTRTERENEVDSTCKVTGTYDEVVYCSTCGNELSRTEKTIPKKDTHTNGTPVNENIVDSTCKEAGSCDEVVYCSVCGVELSRVEKTIDKKTSHTASEAVEENIVDSTCEDNGFYDEVVYCSVCNCEMSRTAKTIDKKNTHTEGEPVQENYVDSTFDEKGSYDSVVYCTVCGKELSRNTITIPEKKHTAGTAVVENKIDPTCKETGTYDEVVYCTKCGEELSRVQKTIEKKTTHTEGSAVEENRVEATCKDVGSYDGVVYCSICGIELSRETKTITKKTTHTASTAVQENIVDSTCKKTGSYDEVVYCSICNCEISRETKTIAKKTTHTEGEPQQENYVDSTFDEKGSYDEVVYCTVCGKELNRNTVTIPQKSHTPGTAIVENKVDSTCKEIGTYDEVVYCTECGEELSRVQKVIEKKTTHTEGSTVEENRIEATCSVEGSYEEVVYCSVCDKELSRVSNTIDKNAHIYNKEIVTETYLKSDATCTKKAVYYYACDCGEKGSNTFTSGDFADHTTGEWVVVSPASCTTNGSKEQCCVECGTTLKTETVPASHNYNSKVHQPTKTEQGYTEYTCTVCKDSYIGDYTPATGSIGLRYSVLDDNKTCIITGIGSCSDTEVYIPVTIDGYTVVEIGDWAFSDCSALTNINIPDSVTSIGNYAFYCCINLTSTTIPNSVTSIGNYAFYCCINLTSITIPDSVSSISQGTFYDCNNLTSVTIFNNITHIDEHAFDSCYNLKDIYYYGTKAEFEQIAIAENGNSSFANANVHYVVEGECVPGDAVIENTIDSTCTEEGSYDEVIYCLMCGDELSRNTIIILKKDHAPGETVIENTLDSTCKDKGSYDEAVYCSACGDELSRVHKTIEKKTTHTEGETVEENKVDSTCTQTGSYDTVVYCSVCDKELSRVSNTIDKNAHVYNKEIVTETYLKSDATCTEKAEYYYSCECGEKGSATFTSGNPLGHFYSTAWEQDDTHHWHKATCEHTSEVSAKTEHNYGSDLICDTCGYEREEDKIIFSTLQVNDTNVYGKVSNTTTTFSFINEIEVSGNATYTVSLDIYGMQVVATKTVALSVGDNTFYVLETIGNDIKLYTVTIRRRPMYTVTFDTNGGTAVESQTVEEDSKVTIPTTTKTGYTFADWDYDLNTAITGNTTVTANWTANEYTITYDANGGSVDNATQTVTYDAEYTLAVPMRTGYTFLGWFYNDEQYQSGTWNGLSNIALIAQWQAKNYTLTLHTNNSVAGVVSGAGVYAYDTTVTVEAVVYLGYNFIGWYNNDILLSTEMAYTFDINCDCELTAQYSKKAEMANFEFSSSLTSCQITGFVNSAIGQVSIPYYVTDINLLNYPTSYINRITNITVSNENPRYYSENNCLIDTTSKTLILGCVNSIIPDNGNVVAIGRYAFYNCPEIYNIIIPEGVTQIESGAFSGCTMLNSITIPDSISNINKYMFENCTNLIEKENGISYINTWVVDCDSNVTHAGIRTNTIGIGSYAFSYCTKINSVYFPNTLKIIGTSAFSQCSGLTSISLPDSVFSIGDNAFYQCVRLESIRFSPYTESIGTSAFYGCSKLSSITVPGSISSIAVRAFSNCSSLKKVIIEKGVRYIDNFAFADCPNLTNVVIPTSVETFGILVFSGCDRYMDIYYCGTVEMWNANGFDSVNMGVPYARLHYDYITP